VKVIEVAGIGPGPFAAMLLADMGADVLRVDRAQAVGADFSVPNKDVLNRGRRSVAIDLKHPDGVATLLRMCEGADALIEGFRPGVAERLGIGPEACLARNPKLVYGRMTGWGQEGPSSQAAGHDINYIALAGALAHFGRAESKPTPPINVVGDFGGGGMFLAFGVVCAIVEAGRSGAGQVVDAAMVDGSALLMTMMWGLRALGVWDDARGVNALDTGAPFYDTYETADGKFVSVGALEPQFYDVFVDLLGVKDTAPDRYDPERTDELRKLIAERFATRTQAEWAEVFEGTDACVAAIIPISEAKDHPHLQAREVYVERDGLLQPAPAPRFSRTRASLTTPPTAQAGADTREALTAWGIADVDALIESGAAVQA
jgi:alpha-methylacyl-CoA racemase